MKRKATVPLIAMKRLRYGTRMLSAGDPFDASTSDSRVLIAVKKARARERITGVLPAPPPDLVEKVHPLDRDADGALGGSPKPIDTGDLTELRRVYAETVGKRPFHGWDEETLRQKIAESAGSAG